MDKQIFLRLLEQRDGFVLTEDIGGELQKGTHTIPDRYHGHYREASNGEIPPTTTIVRERIFYLDSIEIVTKYHFKEM